MKTMSGREYPVFVYDGSATHRDTVFRHVVKGISDLHDLSLPRKGTVFSDISADDTFAGAVLILHHLIDASSAAVPGTHWPWVLHPREFVAFDDALRRVRVVVATTLLLLALLSVSVQFYSQLLSATGLPIDRILHITRALGVVETRRNVRSSHFFEATSQFHALLVSDGIAAAFSSFTG